MPKYTISPRKQASKFRSCEYKGMKVIDGYYYYLNEKSTSKRIITEMATAYQSQGYQTHIEKSKFYGGWNLWARRK